MNEADVLSYADDVSALSHEQYILCTLFCLICSQLQLIQEGFCVYLQLPEDRDDGDALLEEDAADVAARRRAAAKAKEEAELRRRSQVLCLAAVCQPSALLHTCRPLITFIAALFLGSRSWIAWGGRPDNAYHAGPPSHLLRPCFHGSPRGLAQGGVLT